MGNKYEVSVYVNRGEGLGYGYKEIYRGEWLVVALWHLFVGKRKHDAGCVSLHYR